MANIGKALSENIDGLIELIKDTIEIEVEGFYIEADTNAPTTISLISSDILEHSGSYAKACFYELFIEMFGLLNSNKIYFSAEFVYIPKMGGQTKNKIEYLKSVLFNIDTKKWSVK